MRFFNRQVWQLTEREMSLGKGWKWHREKTLLPFCIQNWRVAHGSLWSGGTVSMRNLTASYQSLIQVTAFQLFAKNSKLVDSEQSVNSELEGLWRVLWWTRCWSILGFWDPILKIIDCQISWFCKKHSIFWERLFNFFSIPSIDNHD